MEQRRPTKTDIVDAIVGEATKGQFTGDKRDGTRAPIVLQNFYSETFRCGAKALRARLSRLTFAELWDELEASVGYRAAVEEYAEYWTTKYAHDERDATVRAHSERQSELAQRPRLQPSIVTAARHYRAQRMTAKKAWDALSKTPFKTEDGNTVKIEGGELMRVIMRDGRQQKRPIRFAQWRQRYWVPATKPG